MADFCTCGAQLVPDALFCHKCGKPQRDIVEPEPPPPPPGAVDIPPVVETPRFAPPGFRNPIAMRIALIAAVSATLLAFVFSFLAWVAAGFFAVYFYRRATGDPLNVGGGVKLGWITGVLMFFPTAVVYGIQLSMLMRTGKLAEYFQEHLRKSMPAQDAAVQQAIDFLQTGAGWTMMFGSLLVVLFCFVTGLSMAGGALGAKVGGGRS